MDKSDCPSDSTESSSSWEFVDDVEHGNKSSDCEMDKKGSPQAAGFGNGNNESDTDGISIISENEECQNFETGSDSDESLFKSSCKNTDEVKGNESMSSMTCTDDTVGANNSNSSLINCNLEILNESRTETNAEVTTLSPHIVESNRNSFTFESISSNPYLTTLSIGFVIVSVLVAPFSSILTEYFFKTDSYESGNIPDDGCSFIPESCFNQYAIENKEALKYLFEKDNYLRKRDEYRILEKGRNDKDDGSAYNEKLDVVHGLNFDSREHDTKRKNGDKRKDVKKKSGEDKLRFKVQNFENLTEQEYFKVFKGLEKKKEKLRRKERFLKEKERYLEAKEQELEEKGKRLRKRALKLNEINMETEKTTKRHPSEENKTKKHFKKHKHSEKDVEYLKEHEVKRHKKQRRKGHSDEHITKSYGKKRVNSKEYSTKWNEKNKNTSNFKSSETVGKQKNVSKEKEKNDTVSGEWYNELYTARDKIRKDEHASDWLFEMYSYREKKRKNQSNNKWLFDRANMRSKRRSKADSKASWVNVNQHTHFRR